MTLRAGDVIRLWDGTIQPPDFKRFVVICPDEGWLLRINTKPHWRPHWPISAQANPGCLDHDSYIELRGVIEYTQAELDEAEFLGALCDDALEDLVDHLPTVETFTEDECDLMVAALNAAFD